jgi:hypothetical protein
MSIGGFIVYVASALWTSLSRQRRFEKIYGELFSYDFCVELNRSLEEIVNPIDKYMVREYRSTHLSVHISSRHNICSLVRLLNRVQCDDDLETIRVMLGKIADPDCEHATVTSRSARFAEKVLRGWKKEIEEIIDRISEAENSSID